MIVHEQMGVGRKRRHPYPPSSSSEWSLILAGRGKIFSSNFYPIDSLHSKEFSSKFPLTALAK
jgi:hypothetical protein